MIQTLMNNPSDVLWGALVLASVIAGIILKFKGLITFGKPVERRGCAKKICEDHPYLVTNVDHLSLKVDKIDGKIDDIYHMLDTHIGYHKGKNGIDLRGR